MMYRNARNLISPTVPKPRAPRCSKSPIASRSFFCSSSIVHLLPSAGGWSGFGKRLRIGTYCNTSNRLIDAARHISTLQTIRFAWFSLETWKKMPSNIFRDCSRKYASLIKEELLSGHGLKSLLWSLEVTTGFHCFFSFGCWGHVGMEDSQLREALESWLWLSTHQISSKHIKTIWILSRFFSKRILQIQTVFTTLSRTKAWILWWMTSMQWNAMHLRVFGGVVEEFVGRLEIFQVLQFDLQRLVQPFSWCIGALWVWNDLGPSKCLSRIKSLKSSQTNSGRNGMKSLPWLPILLALQWITVNLYESMHI